MFERFTETARRAIFFARSEASEAGSFYIEPEHLLLGILRGGQAELVPLGIPESFASELRSGLPVGGPKISTSVDLPLSASSKNILSYGAEEAVRLESTMITPEHLLLGVLREKDTLAAQQLARHGITSDRAIKRPPAAATNTTIVQALRGTFEPVASRLQPEVEPAVIFSFQLDSKAGAS